MFIEFILVCFWDFVVFRFIMGYFLKDLVVLWLVRGRGDCYNMLVGDGIGEERVNLWGLILKIGLYVVFGLYVELLIYVLDVLIIISLFMVV